MRQIFKRNVLSNVKIIRGACSTTLSAQSNLKGVPVLLDGVRTPFALRGGSFFNESSILLAEYVMNAVSVKNKFPKELLDECIYGSMIQNPHSTNIARDALLRAGYPSIVPASTISMGSASSLMPVVSAVNSIKSNMNDSFLVGGVDFLSDPPIYVAGPIRRTYTKYFSDKNKSDALFEALYSSIFFVAFEKPCLIEKSTNNSLIYHCNIISRSVSVDKKMTDAHFLTSQGLYMNASNGKKLTDVIPFCTKSHEIVGSDCGITFLDEGHLFGSSPLKERANSFGGQKYFESVRTDMNEIGELISGATMPRLVDGASAIIVMDEAKAIKNNLKPRAFIRDYVVQASCPTSELFLSEAISLAKLLIRNNLKFEDIKVMEINEPLPPYLLILSHYINEKKYLSAFFDHLDLCSIGHFNHELVNEWGSSLVIGQAFSANGVRQISTAINRMHDIDSRYAIVSTFSPGAQSISLLLEKY